MNAAQRRQLAERIAHDLLRVYFENGMISKESMRDAVRLTGTSRSSPQTYGLLMPWCYGASCR